MNGGNLLVTSQHADQMTSLPNQGLSLPYTPAVRLLFTIFVVLLVEHILSPSIPPMLLSYINLYNIYA